MCQQVGKILQEINLLAHRYSHHIFMPFLNFYYFLMSFLLYDPEMFFHFYFFHDENTARPTIARTIADKITP